MTFSEKIFKTVLKETQKKWDNSPNPNIKGQDILTFAKNMEKGDVIRLPMTAKQYQYFKGVKIDGFFITKEKEDASTGYFDPTGQGNVRILYSYFIVIYKSYTN